MINQNNNTSDLTISISQRRYNGHYGKGSIFENKNEFKLSGNNAEITTTLTFCIDEEIRNRAKLTASIPFNIKRDDIINLTILIDVIRTSKNYIYSEEHYTKQTFDRKSLNYTDVTINDNAYELPNDDDILSKLISLLNINTSSKVVSDSYKTLIQNK